MSRTQVARIQPSFAVHPQARRRGVRVRLPLVPRSGCLNAAVGFNPRPAAVDVPPSRVATNETPPSVARPASSGPDRMNMPTHITDSRGIFCPLTLLSPPRGEGTLDSDFSNGAKPGIFSSALVGARDVAMPRPHVVRCPASSGMGSGASSRTGEILTRTRHPGFTTPSEAVLKPAATKSRHP